MRHSSYRTTLEIYTRSVDYQKREANLKVVEWMRPLCLKKFRHFSAPFAMKAENRRYRQIL
jgi:hypothetical protein